ncbi:MAG: choice-of-anchor I family protein [Nitriliruptoraceae bacterium]
MRRSLIASTTAALLLATTVAATAAPPTLDRSGIRPPGPIQIELDTLGTYETGVFDESAAEIVAHDPGTQRLFVVNANNGLVDVLDVSDPADPTRLFALDPAGASAADGSAVPSSEAIINSVAVSDGLIAAAVEAPTKTDDGWVVFFDVDGAVLNALRAGALPDMATFTPDGRTLLVANEGEPDDDYLVDPPGSVSVIDLSEPITELDQSSVRTADFTAWDPGGSRTLDPDVRVFGPEDESLLPSTNLEPEYIVPDADNRTAYVVLQENNATAVLDIDAAAFSDVWPFGFKDHLLPGNELDVSNRDEAISIESWPVRGMYQPDGFDAYRWRGQTLLVTANEGDSRDWDGYSEEERFRGATTNNDEVCDGSPIARFLADDNSIPDLEELREDTALGRLKVTTTLGRADDGRSADGCLHSAVAYGARSFSIWTTDGTQVYDSGSEFERITAELLPEDFNANNDDNDSFDARSDDKGPEPENVTIGRVTGRTYAFIGLERIGGVMVFDISDPRAPFFVQYLNNRDFTADVDTSAAGDLGAEGLLFIEAGDSPTRRPMLAVANEVSGTTTLFDISTTTPGKGRGR